MHFAIRYLTEYRYDGPVTDNLNALRVKPATTATQRVDDFGVRVEPQARPDEHGVQQIVDQADGPQPPRREDRRFPEAPGERQVGGRSLTMSCSARSMSPSYNDRGNGQATFFLAARPRGSTSPRSSE